MPAPRGIAAVEVPRSRCGAPPFASSREWLVTNGTGSYASGTIDGALTRRYHGLLIAATAPPAGRRLLVAKIADVATYAGKSYALTCDRWGDDPAVPQLATLERFHLYGTTPVWTFALGDALLERRVTMVLGADTTVVRYRVLRATAPVVLEAKVIVADRDYHASERVSDGYVVEALESRGVRVKTSWSGERATWIRTTAGELRGEHTWYGNYGLAIERARGLDPSEDHLHAATATVTLAAGESVDVVLSCERASAGGGTTVVGSAPADAFEARRLHEVGLLDAFATVVPQATPSMRRLALAADAFMIDRPLPDLPEGRAILAGYHWFGEWGRDAAISLPGLTLSTGRPQVARAVLLAYGRHLQDGLVPNDFPNDGPPGFNAADAPLWYVEAVRAYAASASPEAATLAELATTCVSIADAYLRGTRYGIGVDPADGLLRAGEAGVQVTWMDAKVGDWVVTPRIGKPVELSALWYNALRALTGGLAAAAGVDAAPYAAAADRARASFARFAGGNGGGLHDVLDGPGGDDPALRPNQIFAVSLEHSPLDRATQRLVVDCCARELLTSHGLRSLAPSEAAFVGHYGGDARTRDGAYHQGTVWPWLIGPFASAHLRAYGDSVAARTCLEPLLREFDALGLGTIAEIADGAAPFRFDGAIAQAWSVAEVLRAAVEIERGAAESMRVLY